MTAHLGNPIPSPAIMGKIGTAFRTAVDRFAADNKIAVVRFGKDDRKIEVMRPYLARQARTGRPGLAAIGIAQEFQNVFAATKRVGDNGVPWFSFFKADRRVTCFMSTSGTPISGRRSLRCAPTSRTDQGVAQRPRVGQTSGRQGGDRVFRAVQWVCQLCGSRRAAGRSAFGWSCTIGVFFQRWMSRLPLPLTEHDRAAGYWWELSMRQIEAGPMVFDAPRHARSFFEVLVAEKLRHRPTRHCGTDLPRAPTPGQAPAVGLRARRRRSSLAAPR